MSVDVSAAASQSNADATPSGLVGSIGNPADLSPGDRDQMCRLLAEYFERIDRVHFERDLAEKEWVVLVREPESRQIRGFTTLMRLETIVDGRPIMAIYSGDTIVNESVRGQAELHRVWARDVWQLAQQHAGVTVYWFLVSCGYKTYRFFPLFFRDFHPSHDRAMPSEIKRHLDALAQMKFADQYDRDSGVVRFADATPLRPGVADVTPQRLQDPHVAYYVAANPGHIHGHGLACLAEITPENLSRAALRMLRC